MRPIQEDAHGVLRFKGNAIVDTLLDESRKRGFGLNELAARDFPQADWEDFYQMIGYSIAGYHELSQVSDASAFEASEAARIVMPDAGGCRDDGCELHCGLEKEEEER